MSAAHNGRCCICGKSFYPHPCLGSRQRTCGLVACQKQRRRTALRRVRDPYRDTALTLPAINTYLQVVGVREANRVIAVKLLSPQQFLPLGAP